MRRAVALSALAAGLLWASTQPALAAPTPGDFTITYDWTNPQTGFAGVQTLLSAPALETPYYQLAEQPGVGLRLTPAISANGVGDRVFPPIDPVLNPYGGPSLIALVNSPPTTQVKSASFSQLSYRRATGENQIMRLAIFGPGGSAGLDTRSDAPPPGPFLDDVTYGPTTFGTVTLTAPGAAGNTVQAWLFTSCGEAPAPPACPTVHFPGGQPDSFGQVGKITVTLRDSQVPAINLAGPLADGAWTNTRASRSAQITATDQGSGMRSLKLERRAGTSGPFKTLLSASAACNRNHTGTGEPGREAAECPATLQRSFTQAMAALADGTYQYRVTATDDSGLSNAKTFTVRIDRRAPRVTFGGQPFHLGLGWLSRIDAVPATLGGTDDHAGIRSIDLVARVNGRDTTVSTITTCSTSTGCPKQTSPPAALPLGSVPDGDLKVRAVAHDAAGNTSADSAAAHLKLDRVAPAAVKAPAAKANGPEVTVAFAHSGGDSVDHAAQVAGLAGYRVTLTDQTFISVRAVSPLAKPAAHGGRRRVVLRASKSALAGAWVLVQAIDKAGNASVSIPVQVTGTKARPRGRPIAVHRPKRVTHKPVDFGFSDDTYAPERADTVSALAGAVRALVPSHRFVALRTAVPYDGWETGGTGPWRDFVSEIIHRYAAPLPANAPKTMRPVLTIEPVVILRSDNFDKCAAKELVKVPVVKAGDPAPRTGRCSYPESGDAYRRYIQEWLDHTGNGNVPYDNTNPDDLPVKVWGAWNEPDNRSFTLADLPRAGSDSEPGATLAAEYWVAAQQLCPSCTILAGEWSRYDIAWVEKYKQYLVDHTRGPGEPATVANRDQPPPPSVWTIHAYNAVLPGKDRANTVRDYIDKLAEHHQVDHVGDFKVWITEIGALLNTPGDPTTRGGPPTDKTTKLNGNKDKQFDAGEQIKQLEQISPLLQRIFYYGAWAPGAAGRFDDQLADSTGAPRPVFCGIRERPDKKDLGPCPGAASTK